MIQSLKDIIQVEPTMIQSLKDITVQLKYQPIQCFAQISWMAFYTIQPNYAKQHCNRQQLYHLLFNWTFNY